MISRRAFTFGVAAAAVAAELPPVPASAIADIRPPIFTGVSSLYNGIPVREVAAFDLRGAARDRLRTWALDEFGEIWVWPLPDVEVDDGRC